MTRAGVLLAAVMLSLGNVHAAGLLSEQQARTGKMLCANLPMLD